MINFDKNSELTVTVESLGYSGEGIARISGKPIFIKGALPGERVKIGITKSKTDYIFARLIEVIEPSADRVTAPCSVFGKCGGCVLQHLDYSAQLIFKRTLVRDTIKKYASITADVSECVPSDKCYRYRNKSQLPVKAQNSGGFACGFYRANSNDIINIDDCVLHPDWFRKSLSALRIFLDANSNVFSAIENRESPVRHFVARETDDALIYTLVIKQGLKALFTPLYESLCLVSEKKSGLYININPADNNIILGSEYIHIAGEKYGMAEYNGISSPVHPASFVQVNDFIKKQIYNDLIRAVSAEAREVITDAYSGAGTLTAMLAGIGGTVFGIEINSFATGDADTLMKNAGIKNVRNITGDAADVLRSLIKEHAGKNSVIVLDPPRKGCDTKMLEAVCLCNAREVFYISCNPATLARDLKSLSSDYNIKSVTPYDMFPQTANVETLVCLQRK